jgi:hypothetical protein
MRQDQDTPKPTPEEIAAKAKLIHAVAYALETGHKYSSVRDVAVRKLEALINGLYTK